MNWGESAAWTDSRAGKVFATGVLAVLVLLGIIFAPRLLNLPFSIVLTRDHPVTALDIQLFILAVGVLGILSVWSFRSATRLKRGSRARVTRLVEFDVVRAAAAVAIVLFHWQPYGNFYSAAAPAILDSGAGWFETWNRMGLLVFEFGYLSVGVFIILAGLGLTLAYYNSSSLDTGLDWRSFYARRVFRIVPLYWAAVVCSFALAFAWGRAVTWDGLLGALALVQIYVPRWYEQLSIANQPLWFVPHLFGLYLIFPLLLLWMQRIGVGVFVLTVLLFSIVWYDVFVWVIPLSNLFQMGLGCAIGYGLAVHPQRTRKLLLGPVQSVILVCATAALLFASVNGLPSALFQPILPALVFLLLWNAAVVFARLPSIVRLAGVMALSSYAVYLFHGLGLRLLPPAWQTARTSLILALVFCLVMFVVGFAIASFEQRIRRLCQPSEGLRRARAAEPGVPQAAPDEIR